MTYTVRLMLVFKLYMFKDFLCVILYIIFTTHTFSGVNKYKMTEANHQIHNTVLVHTWSLRCRTSHIQERVTEMSLWEKSTENMLVT